MRRQKVCLLLFQLLMLQIYVLATEPSGDNPVDTSVKLLPEYFELASSGFAIMKRVNFSAEYTAKQIFKLENIDIDSGSRLGSSAISADDQLTVPLPPFGKAYPQLPLENYVRTNYFDNGTSFNYLLKPEKAYFEYGPFACMLSDLEVEASKRTSEKKFMIEVCIHKAGHQQKIIIFLNFRI